MIENHVSMSEAQAEMSEAEIRDLNIEMAKKI